MHFGAKIPGPVVQMGSVDMDFNYAEHFGDQDGQTGYERLLFDVMIGDQTLFQRADMVETSWAVVDPVLKAWSGRRTKIPKYMAGSWGPKEADDLIQTDGRKWRNPEEGPTK